MLFTKDEKKYVEMCEIFDKEFYSENRDDAKLFKYMYLVFYMLACKENFFGRNFEDYDNYAQIASTIVYNRYIKKQSKGIRYKSLLNYAKGSQRFLKIIYQNQEFETVVGPDSGFDTSSLKESMESSIQSEYSEGLQEDVIESLLTLSEVVTDTLGDLGCVGMRKHRLYVSVLLSLLNGITLSNEAKIQIQQEMKSKKKGDNVSALIYSELEKQRDSDVLLWKLPDYEKQVVRLVVNTVRKKISSEINETTVDYTLPDDMMSSILASAYKEGCVVPESEEEYD